MHMLRSNLPIVLMLACACATSGCATFAQRTPTPAADISPREATSIEAPPGERYFIIVFGSQSTPKRAKYTHSWATLVKVTGADDPAACTIEEQTISWMPASLVLRPLSFRVETGVNLALEFTIEEMLRNDERVSVWGPYEVGPGLAYRFHVQKAFMDSGQVGYQVIDSLGDARLGTGCDCIHAITDMDPLFDRNRYPLTYFGESASLNIVRQLHTRPIIIDPEADHGWLLQRLGLDNYPLKQRGYFGRTIPYSPESLERYLRRYDRS
jgi:hypothetical protein